MENVIVTDKYVRPSHYDAYVGMDIGGSDLTAVVFGYYDYLNATLVIEDEVIKGKEVNTFDLAASIKFSFDSALLYALAAGITDDRYNRCDFCRRQYPRYFCYHQ